MNSIEIAADIARQICKDALWLEGVCTWLGLQMQTTFRGNEIYVSTLGPSLYGGSAGIAYFLAEAYATTGESLFRTTALGAIRHAQSGIDKLGRTSDIGLYSGLAGVMSSALVCGKLCKDEYSLQIAGEIGKRLELSIATSKTCDMISGLAGVVLALLYCWRVMSDNHYLHLAIRCAQILESLAVQEQDLWSWESGPHRERLTGYAHGASGIASSLLELYAITGERHFFESATNAFAFETSHFDEKRNNWKDLRKVATGHQYSVAWCHGAPGILLARLRAFELTKSSQYLVDINNGATTTVNMAYQSLNTRRSDCSLCHGLAGLAMCLDSTTRIIGNAEFSATAEALAVRLYENQKRDGCWSSLLSDAEDTPQLMLGTSGVGHLFLTLGRGVIGPSVLHWA